ncbi:sugar phosphate isomerase/epimerase [Clostridium tetani]|nr:sugar phosphate isomerase/epimerase [Clostridium tetani]RXM75541.1 sugar phosphate isomerase/epimerase [Clostridium tetani]RYU98784.1 sugar phosphate isomerase/epimerase [Clostridium tetani]
MNNEGGQKIKRRVTMFKRIGYAASIGEKSIYDSINFAYENHMNAVEINANVPIYFPENFSLEDRKKIKEYAKNKNVLLTIHAPEDITLLQLHKTVREAGISRLKEIINFGKDIGARSLTLHVGSAVTFTLVNGKSYMDEFYQDEFKKILEDTLLELIKEANGKIKIAVENSGRFPKKVVQEILQKLLNRNEDIYLTWDIGHSYENKYAEVEFFIKNINKIRTCHIHDNNGKSDHEIPGEGNLDFNKHFELMKDKDIVYIIEVRPRENAVKSFKVLKTLYP